MGKIQRNEKGFTMVEVLLVVLTLVVIGVAGYFVAKHVDSKNIALNSTTANSTTSTTKPITSTPATTTPAKTVDPYAGWKQYCNSTINACIKYPSGWSIDICPNPPTPWDGSCNTFAAQINNPSGQSENIGFFANSNDSSYTCAYKIPVQDIAYSDVMAVPGVTNLFYVDMHDSYNVGGGYQVYLALMSGDNGQPPTIPQSGSICLPNTTFNTPNGDYWVGFVYNYVYNSNPGQYNPPQADLSTIKQMLLSFSYQ